MVNAWNYAIPSIDAVLANVDLRSIISGVTLRILRAVGHCAETSEEIVSMLFGSPGRMSTSELERALHARIVLGVGGEGGVRDGMRQRAHIITSEIEEHFRGDSLADIGCGHGLVAWAARHQFNQILLVDIVDYRDPEVTLPFVYFREGDPPPLGHDFDCTLLITVLHHARDPLKLLEFVWQRTGCRLIVIESVFGVLVSDANSPLPNLDERSQLGYAVFCDWFYNRVVNQGVPVPYNFNTPTNWRKVFTQLGATVHFEKDLGVDLEIVPEHHWLFVLDKS